MKKILFLCLLLLSRISLAKTDIEFIIDFSGSMNATENGETRIESARKALNQALQSIPAGTHIAVRVYSHRIEQTNKEESCKDTELIFPLAPIDAATIQSKIAALKPKGWTPIAYSLEQSRADFDITHEAEKVINLLTDGEETCGGDPVAVLKKMQAEGFNVKVNVVGFAIKPELRSQLEAIANAGGGQYFDAQNASELTDALKKATEQSLIIEKDKSTYGTEIRGGNGFDTAVAIQPNIEYKLDHHQKTNDYDYFYIDLQAAQNVTVQLNTFEQGVIINPDGTTKLNDRPYAGLQLIDTARNQVAKLTLISDPNKSQSKSYITTVAGHYFILIGNEYDPQNKDGVSFKITVESHGDAGTDKDAGEDLATALTVEAKRYPTNYLSKADTIDSFTFKAIKGEKYFVGLIPNGKMTGSAFRVTVYDDYKQKVFEQKGQWEAGLKTDSFTIPNDGVYMIRVENEYVSDPLSYIFELGAAPTP